MMFLPALAALAATSGIQAAVPSGEAERLLAEAGHALRQGRLEQARTMVELAVAAGAEQSALDRINADIAYVQRDDARALPLYRGLLAVRPDDPALLERAGVSALRLGRLEEAGALLERAVALVPERWPTLNALGVLADRHGDFAAASRWYRAALAIAPDEPRLLSNWGWSLILQGRWEEALPPLERAVALDPAFAQAAANLELARAATAAQLPRRRPGESSGDFAARLNDAGVAAAARGDHARATAAFTRALESSERWYERAAKNLAALEGAQ